MSKPEYATWYTKQEAADKIKVSTKTIEKFAKDGQIQQARWRRPSGGPVLTIFAREDVDRLATDRANGGGTPQPFVVPPESPAAAGKTGNGNGRALARVTNGDGAAILQAMIQTIQKASETTADKLFLTIPEAAQFSGLSQAYIRRACNDQTLAAIRDGGWKIKRSALLAL